MPITILAPTPDQPFGPGFIVHAKTDFIGPLAPDLEWIATITSSDDQFQSSYGIVQSSVPELSFILGWDYRKSEGGVAPVTWPFFQGATVHVLVQAQSQATGFYESASTQVILDNTTGIPYLQQVQAQVQGQGGMTQEEHTWLDATQQAVQRVFTDVTGAALSTPVGGLLAHPDMTFLDVCDTALDLVGRGALTRPAPGVGVNAYGLVLQVATTPPGFGQRDGAVVTWQERIAQLVALHSIKGGAAEWATEALELHIDTILWLWNTPFPSRILYDVTPGCAVSAQWICARL